MYNFMEGVKATKKDGKIFKLKNVFEKSFKN